jgi:hypothetical protein
MDDLVAFLRARLDEDEAVARATAWNASTQIYNEWEAAPPTEVDGPWRIRQKGKVFILLDCEGEEMVRHVARHDPARVLREVEGKRRIVERWATHEALDRETFEAEGEHARSLVSLRAAYWDACRELAAVHADHPDYRPEWAPTA